MTPGPAAQGHLAMLAFSALVAGSFSLGALVADQIAPAAFTTLRFWLGALITGLLAWRGGQIARGGFAAPWRYGLLGGIFGLYFVLMFEGLKTAAPVSAAAVFTLVPVMSAGFAWLLLRQRLTPRMALALLIGGLGALWVIFRADPGALLAFDLGRGERVYFVGCICHAVYTPLMRRLNRGEPVIVFTFGTLLAGAVILTAASTEALGATDWAALPPLVWVTLAYTTVCATAMTVMLMQFAVMRLPSAKVMAYTYLTPSFVILWELGLGNGAPGWLILGGVALTVLALWLLLRDDGAGPAHAPAVAAKN